MRQSRMWYAKILGQSLPVGLVRMLPQEFFQFAGGAAPVACILGKLLPKLDCQVKGVRGRHLGMQIVQASLGDGFLDAVHPLRKNALCEYMHGLGAQLLVLRGRRQNLFTGALIERDSVQFISSDAPPPVDYSVGRKGGNKILPDQRLDVLGNNKILFHYS